MSNTTLPTTDNPFVLAFGEGEHRSFLNHLATTKITADAGASMSAIGFTMPRGFGPPLHVHDTEDELMIVLDGEIAFRSGDDEFIGGPGATAWLPHGVPHTFQVLSDEARCVVVTAADDGRLQFGTFVEELGEQIDEPVMPEPGPVDPDAVAMAGARNGLTLLGPPPAPLD
ncbi:MAG: cupin domain-containing protein [Actinomycetota bacterium]